MTTWQISVEESVAEAFSLKARAEGKTPEALAAELVAREVPPPANKEWITRFLEHAEKFPGNSRGWKWNRDEIYER